MLGLLSFPNFAEPLVTFLGLTNLADLRVEIFQFLAPCIGRNFYRALFGNQRDLVVSLFISGPVEYRNDLVADRHVVISPARIEQHAVAVLGGAIRERDEQQFSIALQQLVDLA